MDRGRHHLEEFIALADSGQLMQLQAFEHPDPT